MISLNLADIVKKGRANSVLSGRADGAYARAMLKLNDIEEQGEKVKFLVPGDLRELTPSFVLGLFSATFKRIAGDATSFDEIRSKFFELYEISASQEVLDDIDEAIHDFIDVERSLASFSSTKH
jgi:hypothetical protein